MRNSLSKPRAKICILTSVHPVFDPRIFHKQAKTLVTAGYEVALVAQHDKEEIVDGVRIVPLPTPKNRLERMAKTVWKVLRLAWKEKADVYHFHDPELIPVGLALKLLRKKVIYDVHEDYHRQILNKEWVGSFWFRKIVSVIFNLSEQLAVKAFDHVLAATPDIAKKFAANTTTVLRNLPPLELIDRVEPVGSRKDKPAIVYAGGLARVRGIKEIIRSMEIVKDNAELWLLGEWENEEFKKGCEDLDGWIYTHYLGSVPLTEVYQYMKKADIGISMLHPRKNYMTSLPVKAFEYMACSLPIVMSDFPYWQGIFGECALFANPHDPKSIAEKILCLLDEPGKRKKLGQKGRDLIEKGYTWEIERIKLLSTYERILSESKPHPALAPGHPS